MEVNIIIIIILLIVAAILLWQRIQNNGQKDKIVHVDAECFKKENREKINKVEIYMLKVKEAERVKGTPLTKEEKEKIAREVDDMPVSEGNLFIDSITDNWRFDVNDEDVTYRRKKAEK